MLRSRVNQLEEDQLEMKIALDEAKATIRDLIERIYVLEQKIERQDRPQGTISELTTKQEKKLTQEQIVDQWFNGEEAT